LTSDTGTLLWPTLPPHARFVSVVKMTRLQHSTQHTA
jgi:hypothetical protein